MKKLLDIGNRFIQYKNGEYAKYFYEVIRRTDDRVYAVPPFDGEEKVFNIDATNGIEEIGSSVVWHFYKNNGRHQK